MEQGLAHQMAYGSGNQNTKHHYDKLVIVDKKKKPGKAKKKKHCKK